MPPLECIMSCCLSVGGGPRVVVSTAAFHARVRGSVPGLGGLKETKMFLPHPRVKVSIAGSLRDREVACSASDRQGSNFESCVWRTVSSQSPHHPQEVLLAQFSLYVHKGGLKPDSFHFACPSSRLSVRSSVYPSVRPYKLLLSAAHSLTIDVCVEAFSYFSVSPSNGNPCHLSQHETLNQRSLMLVHRLRLRSNIGVTLVKRLVFSGTMKMNE